MTITEHYCGNRLVSVNILSEPEKCCDDSNCCHSETITIKLDTDILNLLPDYSSGIFPLSSPLVQELTFNDNFLFSDIYLNNKLAAGITGFFDLPPPKLNISLSRLGVFLL